MRPPHKLPLTLFACGCACRRVEYLLDQPIMNEACLICSTLLRNSGAARLA